MEKNVTRKAVLEQAVHDCYKEMYAKAQPSVDWDEILNDFKNGKYPKDTRIYERYYLSQEEFTYIENKYMDAYNIKSEWRDYCDTMIEYLRDGGAKDKYIHEKKDEDGNVIDPGYRGYEKVPPIKEQFVTFMYDFDMSEAMKDVAEQMADKVIETMEECKEFYRFNQEENDFRFTCALGASPTSNPTTVVEYWKEQGVDVEIEERCPELFWYYDEGYTDEEIEEEFEKTIDEIKNEWKEKKRKEKEERERRFEELKKQWEEKSNEES